MYRHYWLMVAAICLAFVAAGVVWNKRVQTYRSDSRLYVKRTSTSPLQAMAAQFGALSDRTIGFRDSVTERYVLYLRSGDFWQRLTEEVMADERFVSIYQNLLCNRNPWGTHSYRVSAADLTDFRDVTAVRLAECLAQAVSFRDERMGTVIISAKGASQGAAAELANFTIKVAADFMLQKDLSEIRGARAYLNEQIEQSKQRLKQEQDRLTQAMANSPVSARAFIEGLQTRLSKMRGELASANIEYSSNQALIQSLEAASAEPGPAFARDRRFEELEALELRRQESLMQGLSADSPEIKALDDELAKVRSEIAVDGPTKTGTPLEQVVRERALVRSQLKELNRKQVVLKTRIGSLRTEVAKVEKEGKGAPFSGDIIAGEVQSRVELEYKLLSELSNQLFILEVQGISLAKRIEVLDLARAKYAARTVGLPVTVIAALAFAFGVSTLILLLLEAFNRTIWTQSDVEAFGVPVLTNIPESKPGRSFRTRAFSMAVKELRARTRNALQRAGSIGRPVVISLHSGESGTGKTFLSLELARSFAELGSRVVLVDADLYRQTLSQPWQGQFERGLIDHLQGKATLTDCMVPISDRLMLLPSGNLGADRGELDHLMRESLVAKVMSDLKQMCDIVLVDCPPGSVVADAMTIAAESDLLLMLAVLGTSKREAFERMLDNLTSASQAPRCAVLNKSNFRVRSNSYNYYTRSVGEGQLPPIPKAG